MRKVLVTVMGITKATKPCARSLTIARRVVVITAASALLAVLAVLPVLPSSTAQAAYVTPCVNPCFMYNRFQENIGGEILGPFWASASTPNEQHGDQIIGSLNNGFVWQWVNEDANIWGQMWVNSAGTLCWDLDPSNGYVYIESCQASDHNEWFAFVTCPGGSYCIKNYTETTEPNLSADDSGPVYFSDATNDTNEWLVFVSAGLKTGISARAPSSR
jgi:hypothetical protein